MPTDLCHTAFKFKDPTPPRSAFIPKKLESSPKSKKSNQKKFAERSSARIAYRD